MSAGGPQVGVTCHQTDSVGRLLGCQAGIWVVHRSARSQAAEVVRLFQAENPREDMILRDPELPRRGQARKHVATMDPQASVASVLPAQPNHLPTTFPLGSLPRRETLNADFHHPRCSMVNM